MKSLSNLVKSFFVSGGQEKRVIDYNELVDKKIKEAALSNRNSTQKADASIDASGNGEEVFFAGFEASVVEVLDEAEADLRTDEERIDDARKEAENIVLEANEEAERILAEAKKEADAMWDEVYASAKREGYDSGMQESSFEIDRMRNELQKEKERQQREYTELLDNMESDLVSVILEVFEKVTKAVSADKKSVLVYLINNALGHVENTKEILIRVSEDDYESVAKKRDEFAGMVSSKSSLEVIKDATLSDNQCLIETDGGVFDCGLDTQLENLTDTIKILSCM